MWNFASQMGHLLHRKCVLNDFIGQRSPHGIVYARKFLLKPCQYPILPIRKASPHLGCLTSYIPHASTAIPVGNRTGSAPVMIGNGLLRGLLPFCNCNNKWISVIVVSYSKRCYFILLWENKFYVLVRNINQGLALRQCNGFITKVSV